MRAQPTGLRAALLLLVVVLFALPACGGPAAAPAVAPGAASAALGQGYPDALNVRNQLLLGTVRLEGAVTAVTPEQARRLLPLWQGFKSLTAPGSTAAVQETDAVLAQVQRTMTAEQVAAIAAMRLTTTDLNGYYQQEGLPIPPTPAPGMAAPQPGSGASANLSDPAKQATRTARGVTGAPGSSGPGVALLDNVLKLLAQRAGT